MAYSEFLAERIRTRLAGHYHLEEKKMMGGLVFMVNNKMCLGIDTDKSTGQDRLMVRVGRVQGQELLLKRGSREMDFTGKVLRGFLYIDPEGFDADTDLDFWVAKALEFNTRS